MTLAKSGVTQSFRLLLLPVPQEAEADCAEQLSSHLLKRHVKKEDFSLWINFNLEQWKSDGSPTSALKVLITELLKLAGKTKLPSVADVYFDLHSRLMADHLMKHAQARQFLCDILFIAGLARDQRLTSSQITRLLSYRNSSLRVSRPAISVIMKSLKLEPSLDQGAIQKLFEQDREEEIFVFADADVAVGAETVEAIAMSLGFEGDLAEQLKTLAPNEQFHLFGPYLQVLHYQCVIAEFFDHAMTGVYEFSPRGKVANWIFDEYPRSMIGAGNPVLNNMKSVAVIDYNWVRSKKRNELPGANALLGILESLECLSFSARREVARLIRLWLHRVMRISRPMDKKLPKKLSKDQLTLILNRVAEGNTQTYGILEQRIVDAIATSLHPHSLGWRARGILDSVNATNISRKKLGDSDFQNTNKLSVIAYEAHGGTLTDTYVEEHKRTLLSVLTQREDELKGIADLSDWTITVNFVAHNLDSLRPVSFSFSGIAVSFTFTTFGQFVESNKLLGIDWEKFLTAPLSEKRTPFEVRAKVLEIIQ